MNYAKHFPLLVFLLVAALSTPANAAWTKWYNLSSNADHRALDRLFVQGNSRRMPKKVQCKSTKQGFLVRIDFRTAGFAAGTYHLVINTTSKVNATLAKYKRWGSVVISRQDSGGWSCIIWRKPS